MALFVYLIYAKFLTPKTAVIETALPELPSYERAKQIKEDLFYDYYQVSEILAEEYQGEEELLSDSEINQLFPELWLGKSITCRGSETAYFFGDSNNVFSEQINLNVVGELSPSEDRVAVKIIDPHTISFITAAAVEAGETSGDEWDIIKNTESVLVAQSAESHIGIDTIVVSKKTGLAVWQSIDAGMRLTYEVPHAQTVYLQCAL